MAACFAVAFFARDLNSVGLTQGRLLAGIVIAASFCKGGLSEKGGCSRVSHTLSQLAGVVRTLSSTLGGHRSKTKCAYSLRGTSGVT